MHVTVITPDRAVYQGDAEAVTAPAYDGQVGILPRHAPFITMLGSGRLTVREAGATLAFQVRGGFLQVIDDTVRVVTEHASAEQPQPSRS
jgi:F-type H+-transporting ATPase subunit epsilon